MNDLAVCRDSERRITNVNPAFISIFGGEPDDWSGQNFDGAVLGAQIGAFHDTRAYGQVNVGGRIRWIEWDEAALPGGGSLAIGRINADRRTLGRGELSPERDRRRNKSSISVPGQRSKQKGKSSAPPAVLGGGVPENTGNPDVAGVPTSSLAQDTHTSILLVEDDPLSAKLAMALLGRANCKVTHVEDGHEALEIARQQTFDLVFMDMRMPKLDGPSACRAIRALGGAWADVPIIALTANAFEDDRKICQAAGMTGFVTKPISAQTLLAVRERWTSATNQARMA